MLPLLRARDRVGVDPHCPVVSTFLGMCLEPIISAETVKACTAYLEAHLQHCRRCARRKADYETLVANGAQCTAVPWCVHRSGHGGECSPSYEDNRP